MSAADFEIAITSIGWIDPDLGRDEAPRDHCSHGDIRLEIGGMVILSGTGEGWYTVSTSALGLLRTLESDHSPQQPLADRMILCCGMIYMTSCPLGVDWSVTHLGDRVCLDNVVRDEKAHFGMAVELAEDEYRRQIVAFAEQAKEPFVGVQKIVEGGEYRDIYDAFWAEYDERLSRATS